MKRHAENFLSQISVCTSGTSPVVCISNCLVCQDKIYPPPTYFPLSVFTIDGSLSPLTLGWDGLVPARALVRTVPRVAGIFCCTGVLPKSCPF